MNCPSLVVWTNSRVGVATLFDETWLLSFGGDAVEDMHERNTTTPSKNVMNATACFILHLIKKHRTLGFSGAARVHSSYVAGNTIEKMLSPRPLQAIVMWPQSVWDRVENILWLFRRIQ